MERKALRLARLRKHWTLAQAAEHLEVDLNTLSRWEHGKTRPHGYNLAKLCEVYGRTSAELGLESEQEATDAGETPLMASLPPSLPDVTTPEGETLPVAPLSPSLPDVTTPDAVADSTQKAEVSDHADAFGPSLPLASPPLASPPIFQPQQRSARHFRGLRRAALFTVLLIVIVMSGGIWYSITHLSARPLAQRQHTSPAVEVSTLPSPTQGTANARPTATSTTHPPISTPSTPAYPPTSTSETPASTPTSTSKTPAQPPASTPGTPVTTPKPTATPVPDCLNGSLSSLKFTSVLGLGNTSPSVLVLTNCGGPTQNWFASVATNSGGNWLNAYPSTGTIAVNARESVQIQAAGAGLQIGTYRGSITFTKGSSFWTVTVTYTIVQV